MTKNKQQIYPDTPAQRLSDFLYVYYDTEIAKQMRRNPEYAATIILEDIHSGISPVGRLSAYVAALRDASQVMSSKSSPKTKTAKIQLKTSLTGSG